MAKGQVFVGSLTSSPIQAAREVLSFYGMKQTFQAFVNTRLTLEKWEDERGAIILEEVEVGVVRVYLGHFDAPVGNNAELVMRLKKILMKAGA